ncbi:MAG: YbjQ family protein [Methanotrichaceae archaeon]|nr:YbjQ family protein [Methanotrichaceae archaeon]
MIITTTEGMPGYELDIIGVVYGSTVRSKHLGKDIVAFLKGLFGGELSEYTEMLEDARRQAVSRMADDAARKGADAVVNMRFATSQIGTRAAELTAYGTAVKIRRH